MLFRKNIIFCTLFIVIDQAKWQINQQKLSKKTIDYILNIHLLHQLLHWFDHSFLL